MAWPLQCSTSSMQTRVIWSTRPFPRSGQIRHFRSNTNTHSPKMASLILEAPPHVHAGARPGCVCNTMASLYESRTKQKFYSPTRLPWWRIARMVCEAGRLGGKAGEWKAKLWGRSCSNTSALNTAVLGRRHACFISSVASFCKKPEQESSFCKNQMPKFQETLHRRLNKL